MVNANHPIYGVDATGADAYVGLIAAPRTAGDNEENKEYTNIILFCTTKDAIVSLDGGTTDNIYVGAGLAPIHLRGLHITQAVQGKNGVSGQNYANLVAIVW